MYGVCVTEYCLTGKKIGYSIGSICNGPPENFPYLKNVNLQW